MTGFESVVWLDSIEADWKDASTVERTAVDLVDLLVALGYLKVDKRELHLVGKLVSNLVEKKAFRWVAWKVELWVGGKVAGTVDYSVSKLVVRMGQ